MRGKYKTYENGGHKHGEMMERRVKSDVRKKEQKAMSEEPDTWGGITGKSEK